MQDQFRMSL